MSSLPELPERFEPILELGRGGQASVWLAHDRALSARVAVRRDAGAAEHFAVRAGLRHPSLCQVLDIVPAGGAPWLVEEYVSGPKWTETPPAATRAILDAARHLLCALRYLHDHDVVHRDVKPENLVLQAAAGGPVPVLVDFGLAGRTGAATTRGGTLGTVAPEVLAGTADERIADLFGLGTTLLAAARGQAPDPRWSLDVARLRPLIDEAPEELRSLLTGLCSPDPAGRFHSAADAADALSDTGRTLWTPPETWPWDAQRDALARVLGTITPRTRLVCITGPTGSGRRTLAQWLARTARAHELTDGRPKDLWTDVTDGDVEAFEDIAGRAAESARLLLATTSSALVCGRLRALLGEDAVVEVTPVPFTPDTVAQLCAWLPVDDRLDPAALVVESGGHPASLAVALGGARGDGRARERDDVELYLAVRGGDAPATELAEGRTPDVAAAVAAAERGSVRAHRDGTFALASHEAMAAILHDAPAERLRAMHEIALGREAGSVALHRAVLGDAQATATFLAELAVQQPPEDLWLAYVVRMRGRDALLAHPGPLAILGRRLVVASRIDTIADLLAEVRPDGPPPLVALKAYLLSEQGDPASAIEYARGALARDPGAGVEVHLDLVRPLQFTGALDEALTASRAAAAAARTPREQAEVARLRSLVLYRMGRTRDAIEVAQDALARLPADPQDRLQLGIEQNLAMMLRHAGQHARAAELLDTAAERLVALGDLRSAAIAWINSGIAWQDAGALERSQHLRERALRKCELAGLAQPREVARAGLGIVLGLRGALPAAYQVLRAAERNLAEQSLDREAALARIHALEAAAAIGAEPPRHDLAAALDEACAADHYGTAASAWRALLACGAPAHVARRDARAMLRAADRATRELLRVLLHGRRQAPRSTSALERLATGGLPRTRILARVELTGRASDPRDRRRHLAAALRLARRSESPGDRLRIALRAIEVGRYALGHARAIERALVELSKLWPLQSGDPIVRTWTEHVTALREGIDRILERASSGEADLAPFLKVNRMLLDEESKESERFRVILEEAMRLLRAHRGMLVTRSVRGGERIAISLRRDEDGAIVEGAFDFSRSLLDEVIETGRPRVTVNALEDPEWRHAASVVDFRLASIACVPVRAGDEILGALYLDNPFERGRFEHSAVAALEAFGTQVSLSLAAARRRDEIALLNARLSRELEESHELLETTRRELAEANERRVVIYQSEAMEKVMKQVRRLAATDLPVHVRGATGTGKELIARRVHELSARRDGPFVSENCSAIAGEILESELFGHVAGAFTGAVRDKPGLLRMADGGTLFLDEIGDMPLPLQTRLLRVLQEGEVRPVGGDRTIKVDVRIVTATHRDLPKMVEAGEFREDLYYRIVVAKVALPSLRERREDIRVLANHFLRLHGRPGTRFDDAALAALESHGWPGNVRELESAVRNATALADDDVIRVEDLPISVTQPAVHSGGDGIPTTNLKELERLALQRALDEVGGNRARAAELLGISRSSVFVKIREYGLS